MRLRQIMVRNMATHIYDSIDFAIHGLALAKAWAMLSTVAPFGREMNMFSLNLVYIFNHKIKILHSSCI